MKKVNYNCDCGNTFELLFIEKNDRLLIKDDSGQLRPTVVDNPHDYSPILEACPECNFCPSNDFVERIFG